MMPPAERPRQAPLDDALVDRIEALVMEMGDSLVALDADTYRVQVQHLLGEISALRAALRDSDARVGRARLNALAARLQSQRDALGRQAALVDRSLEVLLPGRTGSAQIR